VYGCAVTELVDLADREHLPPVDLLILDTYTQPWARPADPARRHAPGYVGQPPGEGLRAEQGMPVPRVGSDTVSLIQLGRIPTVMPSRGPLVPAAAGGQIAVAKRDSGAISDSQDLPPAWPEWFGTWLAQLITTTDTWPGPHNLGSLQSLVDQEILMSEAAVPHDQHQLRALHALSRRQALMTLAALPAALITPAAVSADKLMAIPWKCGHFPLADSCNFGPSSDYRTPVHL
jgi:hypothetical protein